MSLLDDLLLGFDEALEWPVDDDAEPMEPAGVWDAIEHGAS